MNVTRNVIQDLLPLYAAGEASADTVALVEEYLRQDTALHREVEALRANPMPDLAASLPPTQEKETLTMTKKLLRLRGTLMGLAIFFTLLPLSFRFDNGMITWNFLRDTPMPFTLLVCGAALALWCGFLYTNRRLRTTGL